MAKILYGVAGEGFGHSSRSHLTGSRLIEQGHELMFAGSRKSLSYLKQYFPDQVKEVFGLRLSYSHGKLSVPRTILENIKHAPRGLAINKTLFRDHVAGFKPDLVISDYEPFCAWYARGKKIPCLTIDHQNTLTNLCLDTVKGAWFSRLNANTVTRAYYPGIKHHIIINFFNAPVKGAGSVLSPPVLRKEVITKTPETGPAIVCYTTDISLKKKIIETFSKFSSEQFAVYGFNINEQSENVTFKPTSTEGFLEDLAKARGVIATAGFSLISECLHFRKKMLLLPLRGQFEQMLNAHYMQKLGMGVSAEKIDQDSLQRFIETIDRPLPESNDILWPDNEKYFQILNQKISQLLN